MTGQEVTDSALQWLSEEREGKYFLLLHYFDPHFAYQHHEEFSRSDWYQGNLKPGQAIEDLRKKSSEFDRNDIDYLEDLYAEEVSFTDSQIGRLLRHFDLEDRSQKTLIVLTSDHGEEFLTHGWLGHTRTLYDGMIRIPLIFWLPGALPPRRVQSTVSLVDVLPTLLSFSRLPMPQMLFDGLSLKRAIMTGDSVAREQLYAEVSFLPPAGGNEDKQALSTALIGPQLKVIHDLRSDIWKAFNVVEDPMELTDLWGDGTAWEEMQLQLLAWEAKNVPGWKIDLQQGPKIDAETLKRLRSLGYVQ